MREAGREVRLGINFHTAHHADRNRPHDLLRIAANLHAPIIENVRFAFHGFDIAEGMPGVGMLGGDAQSHLLAGAADQNGDPAQRQRIEFRPAFFDSFNVALELFESARHGAELVANSSKSSWNQPEPMPSTKRPPER